MGAMKKFCLLSIVALFFASCASSQSFVQTVQGLPEHEPASVLSVPPAPHARAKNIILMIGDGMGAEHVWAAWLCNKGKLNITQLPYTAFCTTFSADSAITDSAAAGTAIACGRKTNNGSVGVDADGKRLASLAEHCRNRGMATGVVVTKAITDATPAAFYAHVKSRRKTSAIARELFLADWDVVVGGGAAAFSPEQSEALRSRGTSVELVAPEHCPPASQRGDFLPRYTAAALAKLEKSPKGFFLMVEGSAIDSAAHACNAEETVREVLDFDCAVGVVLEWMSRHPETLLVVTADHQTGGLSVLDGDRESGKVTVDFATSKHTGVAVPLYAAGAGAHAFRGVMDNTELASRMLNSMSQSSQK